MSRTGRLVLPDYPHHVVHRGHNRQGVFRGRPDYERYLSVLREFRQRYAVKLYAYCLMTNHVHLLLAPASATGIAQLMKRVAGRYTRYYNRSTGRSGTLWEGRFKSNLVQREGYFLACQRYIELNPVRARMVERPGDYRWSSYRANAELQPSQLITPHEEYLALGSSPPERAANYRELFRHQIDPEALKEIRLAVNGGFALGNDRFKEEIARMLGRRAERLRERGSARFSS